MYNHQLKDMVNLLLKKKVIKPEQENKALEILRKYWEDRIAITWATEDVIYRAKMLKKRVSKSHARGILHAMLRNHDCGLGITWDTIDANL